MGRLIDAETLKQELYQQWFMDILLTQKRSDDMFYALAQKIDAQPIAYDPDKVVEQLEKLKSLVPVNRVLDDIINDKPKELGNDIADVTKWKPSIHMPKEAARIWLKVTDVRVERLQDMTSEQISREGVEVEYPHMLNGEEKRYAFSTLWNSTIKKSDIDRYGWDANPYVWVISFERCEKSEGV